MTAQGIVADVLLGLAVALVLASSAGILVMRDTYQKLHYLTPLALIAPLIVGLAVTRGAEVTQRILDLQPGRIQAHHWHMHIAQLPGKQPGHRLQISGELLPVPRGVVMVTADHSGQEKPAPIGLAVSHCPSPCPASPAAIAAPVSFAVRYGLTA